MGLERVRERSERLEWDRIRRTIDEQGYATVEGLLSGEECAAIIDLYGDERRFRSRIDMARLRFGVGEYKYFAYPLPPLVQELRRSLYSKLVALANRWRGALGEGDPLPLEVDDFLAICRRHGQTKPTPLILRYQSGGYNCLHQDLYGKVAFPLQLTCVLSRREVDYTGGEFLLVEQRPRAQSRGHAIVLEQGEAVIFATRFRPVAGQRGYYRVNLRHGVSRLHAGSRYSLGVIFHDAA